jgi:O-succinylbenzoic acid--CoA ligase
VEVVTPDRESWIERAARLHPERLAVDSLGGAVTNAQLERAAWSVADLLVASYPRASKIAVPVVAGVGFAAALHGCLRAGMVLVPIDPRLPEERQGARLAVCDGTLDRGALDDAIEHVPEAPNGWLAYTPHAEARRSWQPPAEAPRRPLAGTGADAETPAVLLHTSGTTGPGTPVLLSRGNLLWNAIGSQVALGQPPSERWLSAMPVAHVGGLTVFTRSAIGATTAVVRPRFDVDEQVALLMGGEATITSVVPTMLGRMLDAGLEHPPNLRLVLLGGAPITPELVERAAAAGVSIASTYGMTEACSQVFTAGAPLFCTRVALRGEIDPTATPEAADEILVRGPTVAPSSAGPDGWLATGDRGARLPDGVLSVVGRIAETIITGGENVAPTEVEAHLLAQPAIADAAVLGVPDPEWGERLEARVVLAPGATLDEPAVRLALRASLPPFAVPKAITVVDELPRTPTGKLRRRDLR